MKRELNKFLCCKSTIIFFYIVSIIFALMMVYMGRNINGRTDLSSYLGEYDNEKQLAERYNEVKESYEINKADYEELGLSLEPINESLAYYEYVLEHYIEASDGVIYSQTYPYESRDSLSVMMTIGEFVTFIMLISLGYFTIVFFSADFSGNRHLLLYAGRDRKQLLKEKFQSYFVTATVLYLILQILSIIFTAIFSEHISNVLFYYNEKVYCFPFMLVRLFELFSGYIRLIPYFLVFFFFGVLTRSESVSGIADILFFLGINYIPVFLDSEKLMFNLGREPFYSIAFGDTTLGEWTAVYAVEMLLIVLLACISMFRFRKVNLA